ncbi:DUF4105 domain-containing protein [Flavobacterium sp.]|uniref:Lnb N-terminal periplasmic domain-containing protein n=1 Tax=Flavobacterium sp. TaxID=239 RepID=UPI003BD65D99
MTKKLLSVVFLFLSILSFSQNIPLSNKATVSIFTCGRGNELYTTFGHTAIRIKDESTNMDVVYNYGAFDFNTDNFYLKFVKGDLQYFINASSYDDFIYEYQMEQREVIEQTLNFSPTQKQELFDLLNASLYSEERSYTYKFIDRNCTTMVVEKINKIIGKELIQKVDGTSISYRELLYPYFANHFYYKLGINIIFGAKTDSKAVKLFLPSELMHSLDKASIDGIPLVIKKETLIQGNKLESGFHFVDSIYFIALLLLILVVTNKKKVYLTYLFISGLLGLFLSLVGLYSLHKELLWNYNALLFNPIFLLIPFLKGKWLKKIIQTCLLIIGIYLVLLLTKPHIWLMLPFIIVTTYMLWKLQKKERI